MNTTRFDFTPLLRSTVGFDAAQRLLEGLGQMEPVNGYPPHDILKHDETTYEVAVAAAGFSPDEISVTEQDGTLIVAGQVQSRRDAANEDGSDAPEILHHGIAKRAFEKRFRLAEHVRTEDARFDNGLLRITLKKEIPEAKQPRSIPIAA